MTDLECNTVNLIQIELNLNTHFYLIFLPYFGLMSDV